MLPWVSALPGLFDGRLEQAITRSPLARFSARVRERVGGASESQSAPA